MFSFERHGNQFSALCLRRHFRSEHRQEQSAPYGSLPAWRSLPSGGCGVLCFQFLRKNGGISYCFFRQNGCRFRRRCLTEGSLAAVASTLPEKTVRNPHFLCRTENTRYRSRRTEGIAMPGDCHAEQTVPADALSGNAGAGIKPKIDFRAKIISEGGCGVS